MGTDSWFRFSLGMNRDEVRSISVGLWKAQLEESTTDGTGQPEGLETEEGETTETADDWLRGSHGINFVEISEMEAFRKSNSSLTG